MFDRRRFFGVLAAPFVAAAVALKLKPKAKPIVARNMRMYVLPEASPFDVGIGPPGSLLRIGNENRAEWVAIPDPFGHCRCTSVDLASDESDS